MNIKVGQIQFGEIDAKNEVFGQERAGSNIFKNSFEIPPRIDLARLLGGIKFFIYGQKGCGKTALLLYLKSIIEEERGVVNTVLFKSGITERERQAIAQGKGFQIVEKEGLQSIEYDYKINWLWYIYRNIFRLVSFDDKGINSDSLNSMKKLLQIDNEVKVSSLSDISTKNIKANAKAGLNAGPFSGEIFAEVEAVKNSDPNLHDVQVIEIIEKNISKIASSETENYFLLFDELELFWNRKDQRERDLFLIRDLLYAVTRVNRVLGNSNFKARVVACVRSEVLNEVNKVGPEVARDVDDLGERINWNVSATDDQQPILKIIEKKITQSEIENDQLPSQDVWSDYFPNEIFNRKIRKYFLSVAMFKPRNIVTLLSLAKDYRPDLNTITNDALENVQQEFSRRTWREIEEELSTEFSADEVRSIKVTLTGMKNSFGIQDFKNRIMSLSIIDKAVATTFSSEDSVPVALRALYRAGAIGNRYYVESDKGHSETRFGWIYRDTFEPLLDKDFLVHESIRRELQMTFENRQLDEME